VLTRLVDWAYLEDWCRRLTRSFSDVYVFTIPLYLPHKDKDGKSRVVSGRVQRSSVMRYVVHISLILPHIPRHTK
jgi:DNA/RNA endonuclease G (NUC1)